MNLSKHILLAEDDQKLSYVISEYLQDEGYRVTQAFSGTDAIKMTFTESPDVIILDLMLPGCHGFDVCQTIRKDFQGPIIMLTASDSDEYHIEGLKMGADDFISKPIRPNVLLARIEARLNVHEANRKVTHPELNTSSHMKFGRLTIDLPSRSVLFDGHEHLIKDTEYELLIVLAQRAGQAVSREVLVKNIRGIEYDGQDRSIDLRVSHLRKKLDEIFPGRPKIKTVRGQGYLFVPNAWDE